MRIEKHVEIRAEIDVNRASLQVSNHIKKVATVVLREMRKCGKLRLDDLRQRVDASEPSVRRALRWLCDEHDAPIRYDRRRRIWVLEDRAFNLPLLDPTSRDLVAVAVAAALLSPFGDAELDTRLRSLLMELDERVSERPDDRRLRSHAVVATSSATMSLDSNVVSTLTTAVGRDVVLVSYSSPWSAEQSVKTHSLEPWQLRVHDGCLYLRAWVRKKNVAGTFRVSQVGSIAVTGESLSRERPPIREIWGSDGLGNSVDVDHPDRAIVRIVGPMARYVASMLWHEDQRDHWIEQNEVLQRMFSYDSRRTTARRLLGLGEALQHVEPRELREELARHVAALGSVVERDEVDSASIRDRQKL